MTGTQTQNAIEIKVSEGGSLSVTFSGAGGQLFINGQEYAVNETGLVLPTDVAPQPQVKREPQVGDMMEDGTVLGGISPDTNKPMYVRPADEPLTMKWKAAMDYAARLEGHGKPAGTFRVPTDGELNVLFQNRAKIGGFNETGSHPAGWYWSSTQFDYGARDQSFSDGDRGWRSKGDHSSVRLVRS